MIHTTLFIISSSYTFLSCFTMSGTNYFICSISNAGGAPEQAYRKMQMAGASPERPLSGKKMDPLVARIFGEILCTNCTRIYVTVAVFHMMMVCACVCEWNCWSLKLFSKQIHLLFHRNVQV
jgi:hypothetical protein